MNLQLFANDSEDMEQEEQDMEQQEQQEEERLSLLDLLDKDEDMMKEFQSEVDSMISKAIATRDRKHAEEIKKQEQRSRMTAEELQLEKERELKEREQKIQDYELRLAKVEYFKENGIDMNLIDFVSIDSVDELEDKTKSLTDVINAVVESRVAEKLKENGYNLNTDDNSPIVSLDDMSGMSVDEINQHWNAL